jgi:hypothetical protein
MRGVAGRRDGEHVQHFERTMTHSSAGRLDVNQEIGFAVRSVPRCCFNVNR